MKKPKKSEREIVSEGPIMEWEQDQWWKEGKSRRTADKKPFFKSPKSIVVAASGLIVFIFAVLFLAQLGRNRAVDQEEDTQEELIQELGITPLQKQIKQLRSQLNAADPAIRDTPLPQVEMNITITDQ